MFDSIFLELSLTHLLLRWLLLLLVRVLAVHDALGNLGLGQLLLAHSEFGGVCWGK